jgi:hypothetical protein
VEVSGKARIFPSSLAKTKLAGASVALAVVATRKLFAIPAKTAPVGPPSTVTTSGRMAPALLERRLAGARSVVATPGQGRNSVFRACARVARLRAVPRLELGLVVTLAVLAVLLLVVRPHAAPPPSPHCRGGPPLAGVYHSPRLEVKKHCALATGVVTKVKFEEFDGDVHVDLRTDDGDELVVEVIPQDRAVVPIPDTGAHVTVVGPQVWDTAHDWAEIHPAWWISSGRIVPASTQELARVESLLRDDQREQEVSDD